MSLARAGHHAGSRPVRLVHVRAADTSHVAACYKHLLREGARARASCALYCSRLPAAALCVSAAASVQVVIGARRVHALLLLLHRRHLWQQVGPTSLTSPVPHLYLTYTYGIPIYVYLGPLCNGSGWPHVRFWGRRAFLGPVHCVVSGLRGRCRQGRGSRQGQT